MYPPFSVVIYTFPSPSLLSLQVLGAGEQAYADVMNSLHDFAVSLASAGPLSSSSSSSTRSSFPLSDARNSVGLLELTLQHDKADFEVRLGHEHSSMLRPK